MATTFQSSTPPPPSLIHTPSTPKFGKEDNYEPYSPRRKSSRISQRSQSTRTPPFHKQTASHSPNSSTRRLNYIEDNSSPPSSPQTAPKRQTPENYATMGGRRISGALNHESAAFAATSLGLPSARNGRKFEAEQSDTRDTGMLPTPAKTPKKQPNANASMIKSVARNLFPIRGETVDEVMPSPKKKGRKRYTGFTLDSFEAEEDGPIPIYTDSSDRVPEVDTSINNPFYGESTTALPDPRKRSSKRRKVTIPGEEEEQTVSEAEKREDGLVYVFRGKKIFRKFTDKDADESGLLSQDELDTEIVEKSLDRPLTRSAIKPRLLFPTPQQVKAMEMRAQVTEDEEEAVTDIEEHSPLTPMDHISDMVFTPKAPRFAPASPPTTARVTRSKDVLIGSPPAEQTSDDELAPSLARRGGKVSPFDGWKRTKNVSGAKKRGGEPLTKTRGIKKLRG